MTEPYYNPSVRYTRKQVRAKRVYKRGVQICDVSNVVSVKRKSEYPSSTFDYSTKR